MLTKLSQKIADEVTFPSRGDHLMLRGWFIPGILPKKHMTTERTLILVYGLHANRAFPTLACSECGSGQAWLRRFRHGFA